MWYDTLYEVLTAINNVILYFIGVPFLLQLIYMCLFWVKKKTYKKSDKKHRCAILIAARNEESVIYNTIKDLLDNQDYPKDLFDVYVVAHNCTDGTALKAKEAGAKVFALNDPDKSHHIVCYALKAGVQEILDSNINYDFIIRLDADNHVNKEFISLMNDAFSSGVKLARPYESAININQSGYTKACGLYYVFDSRFSSRVRERLHIDAHCQGPGLMFSMEIARKYGFDAVTICEDTEFNFERILQGYRAHYVEDAVVYEDLPSTFKDTYARNIRLGSGNILLLKRYFFKLFGKFFTTLHFSYIEQILTFLFIPICPILCIWLPLYYIYAIIFLTITGQMQALYTMLIIIGIVLLILFLFMGILQSSLLVILDYKKMGAKRRRDLIPGIILFPVFTIIYCITITIGVFSKPKWIPVRRNPQETNKK